MAKVRWTTRCAGDCGKWLTSGSRATFAFHNWFCDDCIKRHAILRK